ncbi:MAG TPA: hypothetical protein PLD99_02240 [Parcubacteria group bacterium]|nr:hypothetical protein [Parcubacteria group bacterium]
MYKLLTPEETNKVKKEYSLRRLSVSLALLSAVAMFMIITLLPALIFTIKKKESALFTLSTVNKPLRLTNKQSLDAWVERTKLELTALTPDGWPDTPYIYFKKIIDKKPNSITIGSLSFSRAANGNKNTRVVGTASNRKELLAFQSALNESGDWTQVDLPLSTIAREADIPFEMNLVPQKIK